MNFCETRLLSFWHFPFPQLQSFWLSSHICAVIIPFTRTHSLPFKDWKFKYFVFCCSYFNALKIPATEITQQLFAKLAGHRKELGKSHWDYPFIKHTTVAVQLLWASCWNSIEIHTPFSICPMRTTFCCCTGKSAKEIWTIMVSASSSTSTKQCCLFVYSVTCWFVIRAIRRT